MIWVFNGGERRLLGSLVHSGCIQTCMGSANSERIKAALEAQDRALLYEYVLSIQGKEQCLPMFGRGAILRVQRMVTI